MVILYPMTTAAYPGPRCVMGGAGKCQPSPKPVFPAIESTPRIRLRRAGIQRGRDRERAYDLQPPIAFSYPGVPSPAGRSNWYENSGTRPREWPPTTAPAPVDPAPHSSFRRRPESRGVGMGECTVADCCPPIGPGRHNHPLRHRYQSKPRTPIRDTFARDLTSAISSRPRRYSNPPIVIPAKAGIQRGGGGPARIVSERRQQGAPFSLLGVPAPTGISDSYENRGYPSTARCPLTTVGPVIPVFDFAIPAPHFAITMRSCPGLRSRIEGPQLRRAVSPSPSMGEGWGEGDPRSAEAYSHASARRPTGFTLSCGLRKALPIPAVEAVRARRPCNRTDPATPLPKSTRQRGPS